MIKNIKHLEVAIFIAGCIAAGMAGGFLSEIITYVGVDSTGFKVEIATDKQFSNYYCLYINGKNHEQVDYNEYCMQDRNGNQNPKMSFLVEQISSLVKAILILFVLRNAYALVGLLKNSGLKNVSAITKKLKKTAIGIIMVPVLPFIVGQGIRGAIFMQSHIKLSFSDFLLFVFGIIIFMGAGLIKNFDNSATLNE